MGQSGQAIIRALIAGDDDPVKLAELAHRRIKAAPDTLIEALRGRVTRHHRFLLELHMKHIGTLDGAIASIDEEVARRDEPFREALWRLITIPGVGPLTAREILAESGIDMSRFPTSGQLVSWAGLCPRNDESAGRRRSNRMRKGAQWLKATLVQCAWAAIKKKDSYLLCGRSSIACVPGAAPRRRSAPSRPQSWSPSTTCSAMEPATRTRVPITSTATPKTSSPSACAFDWRTSAMTSISHPRPRPDLSAAVPAHRRPDQPNWYRAVPLDGRSAGFVS
jgi:hypothetical protein